MAERVSFKCGSVPVPSAVTEYTVTGLSIPFEPAGVLLSLRRPSADSDLIDAFVSGVLSSSGFSVQFSAEIPSEGYCLDYQVFSDGEYSPTGDTLAVSYTDLVVAVSRFLGYGETLAPEQSREVDSYIQSGLRQFYYPPATAQTEAGYQWSFLDQIGEITTASGVAAYTVPNTVGRIIDPPTPTDGQTPPLPLVSEALVLARTTARPELGRPCVCCLRHKTTFGVSGQAVELAFWPVPDGEYTYTFRIEGDCSLLSASNPVPLGGPKYSELIIESCLAVAEQRANDETGLHTERFTALLTSAIAQDRKMSAGFFGPMSPRRDCGIYRRHFTPGPILYNGRPV